MISSPGPCSAIVLGGRLGYILFYDLAQYIEEPLKIFFLWQGGMSFHGGLLGMITRHGALRPPP